MDGYKLNTRLGEEGLRALWELVVSYVNDRTSVSNSGNDNTFTDNTDNCEPIPTERIEEICVPIPEDAGLIPIASENELGCVKIGEGLEVDDAGTVTVTAVGSSIYIGSGEMPEGCNVKIDPEGSASEVVTKSEFDTLSNTVAQLNSKTTWKQIPDGAIAIGNYKELHLPSSETISEVMVCGGTDAEIIFYYDAIGNNASSKKAETATGLSLKVSLQIYPGRASMFISSLAGSDLGITKVLYR